MSDESQTFVDLVRAEMDRSGLDEWTAAGIVSARLAGAVDPAALRITSAIGRALAAPPTWNEPDVIPPPPPACPSCDGAGWYKEAVPYGHPSFGKLFPCACTLDRQSARRIQQQAAILARLDDDLGSDLRHCTFATWRPTPGIEERAGQQRALADVGQLAVAYADSPRGWLYLWGGCGVGKSHLAAAIAHQVVADGLRAAYASAPSLLRFVKAGIGDRSSDDRLFALQRVALLILDDLGAEQHTGYNDQLLFELINHRYLHGGLTVLTSNLPLDEIETRVASRIRGRARVVFVDGDDQRGQLDPWDRGEGER